MQDRPLALVLRALGTNCEGETVRAFELAGADTRLLHLNALLSEPTALDGASALVIPGGFSYGDYVSAGRVFGHELRTRLGEAIGAFVERGGRVLGVCNGFQVLVELGLIDGVGTRPADRRIALTGNRSNRYECRWVWLRNEGSRCEWLPEGEVWPVPVAHAEGRIALKTEDDLERLRAAGQVVLRYVDEEGGQAAYPDCPNGSVGEVAGLCDPTGRVLGLMPHPERNLTPWNHPRWTRLPERSEGEGVAFYRALVGALA
ncbi:MAG: phosphoribosylformylglycinamidine synthase I [Planctomycetota bacterium]|jgi:phosphoribosylformylglycinamidine synthase